MISPQTPNPAQRTDQIQNFPKIITGTVAGANDPEQLTMNQGFRV